MKVGLAGFGYGSGRTGGVQVYLRGLARALASSGAVGAAGAECTLLLGPGDPEPPADVHLRVTRLDPPASGGPPWRRAARLLFGSAQALDRLGLDVVHFPGTRLPDAVPRTPGVLTFFDMQEEFLPRFFTWRERLARRVLHRRSVRRARLVIAPSRFTAECLAERYGTPPAKLRVVPAGVEPAFFEKADGGEAEYLRERHGLVAGEYLLYPANPWPHKNHLRLFRALARLERRVDGAPLVVCTGRVAGEPRRVSALGELAGLRPGRVRDLGFVPDDDLPALVRGARGLFFPSLFEGFGLPVAEALAAGCPVACAAIPPLQELAGDAARFFDPYDEAALAAALGELWDDASLRARLAAAGRARAEAYRWERLVPGLVAAYRDAARA